MNALIYGLVAGIHGTGDAVTAVHGLPGPAVQERVACLAAVAKGAVVAESAVRYVPASVPRLVASIHGAGDSVVTDIRRTPTAGSRPVADLAHVAEQPVVAACIHGFESAGGGTAVARERIAVIAILGRVEVSISAHCRGAVGVGLVIDQIAVVVEAGEAAGEVLRETR